jgi:uncharacterized membrane-anchored protein YhcB (DUF1043 family)
VIEVYDKVTEKHPYLERFVLKNENILLVRSVQKQFDKVNFLENPSIEKGKRTPKLDKSKESLEKEKKELKMKMLDLKNIANDFPEAKKLLEAINNKEEAEQMEEEAKKIEKEKPEAAKEFREQAKKLLEKDEGLVYTKIYTEEMIAQKKTEQLDRDRKESCQYFETLKNGFFRTKREEKIEIARRIGKEQELKSVCIYVEFLHAQAQKMRTFLEKDKEHIQLSEFFEFATKVRNLKKPQGEVEKKEWEKLEYAYLGITGILVNASIDEMIILMTSLEQCETGPLFMAKIAKIGEIVKNLPEDIQEPLNLEVLRLCRNNIWHSHDRIGEKYQYEATIKNTTLRREVEKELKELAKLLSEVQKDYQKKWMEVMRKRIELAKELNKKRIPEDDRLKLKKEEIQKREKEMREGSDSIKREIRSNIEPPKEKLVLEKMHTFLKALSYGRLRAFVKDLSIPFKTIEGLKEQSPDEVWGLSVQHIGAIIARMDDPGSDFRLNIEELEVFLRIKGDYPVLFSVLDFAREISNRERHSLGKIYYTEQLEKFKNNIIGKKLDIEKELGRLEKSIEELISVSKLKEEPTKPTKTTKEKLQQLIVLNNRDTADTKYGTTRTK